MDKHTGILKVKFALKLLLFFFFWFLCVVWLFIGKTFIKPLIKHKENRKGGPR